MIHCQLPMPKHHPTIKIGGRAKLTIRTGKVINMYHLKRMNHDLISFIDKFEFVLIVLHVSV